MLEIKFSEYKKAAVSPSNFVTASNSVGHRGPARAGRDVPHPSPRNRPWLRANAWFERDCVPAIVARIKHVLASPR